MDNKNQEVADALVRMFEQERAERNKEPLMTVGALEHEVDRLKKAMMKAMAAMNHSDEWYATNGLDRAGHMWAILNDALYAGESSDE